MIINFGNLVVQTWTVIADNPFTVPAIKCLFYENVKPMKLVRPLKAAPELCAPEKVYLEIPPVEFLIVKYMNS